MEFVTLGKYSVKISRCGYVVSTITNKQLNATPDKYGYPRVYPKCIDGKRRGYYVHRLLAIAFIPNPYLKGCVNHKDGNKGNFSLENLEWSTLSENQYHSHAMGLYKQKDKSHFKDERNAVIKKLASLGVTQYNISIAFGLSGSRVSKIIRGIS